MNILKNISHLKMLLLSSLVFGALALLVSPQAFAATKAWTGATDDNWSTAGNWSPSGAPVDGDDLTFDADTISLSYNDISGLTVNNISFTGSNTGVASIRLNNPTIVSGSITNSSPKTVSIHGGFTLGADVVTSGNLVFYNLNPAGSALNELALAGHKLSVTNNPAGIAAMETPITGSGTVEYNNLGSVHLGAVNTYSGSTIFVNVTKAWNTTIPSSSQHPTQMFGTSSITIDADSVVALDFSANGTFTNTINLASTTVNGNVFNGQISVENATNTGNLTVSLPNIVLNGDGGMSVDSGIASIDLAGIQANGHCLYLQTIYLGKYLNAPTVCNGSANYNPSTVPVVPGVPNSGDSRQLFGWIVAASLAGISLIALGVKRGLIFSKVRR